MHEYVNRFSIRSYIVVGQTCRQRKKLVLRSVASSSSDENMRAIESRAVERKLFLRLNADLRDRNYHCESKVEIACNHTEKFSYHTSEKKGLFEYVSLLAIPDEKAMTLRFYGTCAGHAFK